MTSTLSEQSPAGADISVTAPAGDPSLPAGSVIPVSRVAIDPATGKPGAPAKAINTVSGWLDASMVYGSDATTAASLRLPDGHLKTSPGGNLPVVDTPRGRPMRRGTFRPGESQT